MSTLRIVLLCCEGFYQTCLAAELAARFELAGVVFQRGPDARPSLLKRLSRYWHPQALGHYLQARRRLPGFERGAAALRQALFCPDGITPQLPTEVPCCQVENINAPAAVAFLRDLAPDMVCVNGTNLLRKPMLDLIGDIPLGIINLHTGLSPYSRGGNCNLFMLLEGLPEYVGVTIHHIDPGIDSGDLIITARPELEPTDSYETIDVKTFRLGIDAMLQAVQQLREQRAERIPQWTRGKLFLRRTGYVYTPYQRLRANTLLQGSLIADYLADRQQRDAPIRLVGSLP